MNNIERRLAELEQRIHVRAVPSFEEFSTQWETFDPLSKALLAENASHPDDADSPAERRYYNAIKEYLRRMGVDIPDGAPSLREIAAELEISHQK